MKIIKNSKIGMMTLGGEVIETITAAEQEGKMTVV